MEERLRMQEKLMAKCVEALELQSQNITMMASLLKVANEKIKVLENEKYL